MTAAVDVFSGSVVGFHIHGGAPSSTDHAVLFARIVSPAVRSTAWTRR